MTPRALSLTALKGQRPARTGTASPPSPALRRRSALRPRRAEARHREAAERGSLRVRRAAQVELLSLKPAEKPAANYANAT